MASQQKPKVGRIAVDTVADLTTLFDTRMSDGDDCWVVAAGVSHGKWVLDQTSALAADGVAVAATLSGVGRWILFGAGGGGTTSKEPIRLGVQGVITANFFLGNANQTNAAAKSDLPIAIPATYTTIRVKTSTVPGGSGLTYTVFKNGGATGIAVLQGPAALTALATVAGVAFAAGDTMCIQMTGDGTPSSPEAVVT